MFGFGIALMHIVDYFARRKHDKKERKTKIREDIKENRSQEGRNNTAS
jgi:hypothetical protein